MIKAGLIGWLRFLLPSAQAQPEWSAVFMVGGLAAAFYGVAVGLMQVNPKTLLAYSSISQMGLMTLGVGMAFAIPAIQPAMQSALIFFAAHHGLTKAALFLGVGAVSAIGSSTYRMLLAAGLGLAALSLAGMPLTSGAVAKSLLKSEVSHLPGLWKLWVTAILPLATVGTTLLMGRYLILLARIKPASDGRGCAMGWPLGLLILIVMSFIWFRPETAAAGRESVEPVSLWKGLWPIGIGLLAGWAGRGRRCRWGGSRPKRKESGGVLAYPHCIRPVGGLVGERPGPAHLIVSRRGFRRQLWIVTEI
jgi:formate hydrogenlyase subunit 3/multisubunit Na+/H+ antiporter MnhD subunit